MKSAKFVTVRGTAPYLGCRRGFADGPVEGRRVAFLIAYDIGHPRRLRRVARLLERRAVRCQYSVFVFRGTGAELRVLLDELGALVHPTEDVVQAWPVPPNVPPEEFARGAVRPVRPTAVIVAAGRPLFVLSPNAPAE